MVKIVEYVAMNDGEYGSPLDFRREALAPYLMLGSDCLEVGPFLSPTMSPLEVNLKTVDYYSTEDLRQQALNIGRNPNDVIHVDYVCKTEKYTDYIEQKFDAVIANHVAEHVIDFVQYLIMLRAILKKNGLLFLVFPDKRYGFDSFRQDTTLSHLIYEYLNPDSDGDKLHSLETEMYYDMTYAGGVNDPVRRLDIESLRISLDKWHPGVHSHVFQFETIGKRILAPLCAMKIIDFDVVSVTMSHQFGEFAVVLTAGNQDTDWSDCEIYSPATDTIPVKALRND